MKILFVCLGNICRSPLAEALFKKHCLYVKISESVSSDSCGIGNWHSGEQPDHRILKIAKENNLDIYHLARQIHPNDLASFDYILAMDYQNIDEILKRFPNAKDKVRLLSSFSKKHFESIVADPYYGDEIDFQKTHQLLDELTLELATYIKTKHID
jgi:protein-tyrosine phosphatase